MKNLDKFMEVYEQNLKKAVLEKPEEYRYPVEMVPRTAQAMRNAIEKNCYNKDGFAFKWTCKHFGIKHTYQAINGFLKGE